MVTGSTISVMSTTLPGTAVQPGGVTLALHAPALGFAIWPSSAQ